MSLYNKEVAHCHAAEHFEKSSFNLAQKQMVLWKRSIKITLSDIL